MSNIKLLIAHVQVPHSYIKGRKYLESKSIHWKDNIKIIIDSVEDYARQWTKREKGDLNTLSE